MALTPHVRYNISMSSDFQDIHAQTAQNSTYKTRLLTKCICLFEEFSRVFWVSAVWVLAFFALWLLEIPQNIGISALYVFNIVFLLGLVLGIIKGIKDIEFPDPTDIDRRIEQASGLKNRPLDMIEDTLVNPHEKLTRALWIRQVNEYKSLLSSLRPPAPKPILSYADPYAVRFSVILLFLLAIVISGPKGYKEIFRGLWPYTLADVDSQDDIAIWITPPEYTGKTMFFVSSGDASDVNNEKIIIPEGSTIKVRLDNIFGAPILTFNGPGKEVPIVMERLDKHTYGYEGPVKSGDTLSIRKDWFTTMTWEYEYVVDQPPEVLLSGDIELTPGHSLRFPLSVYDDYGADELTIKMNLASIIDYDLLGHPYKSTRPIVTQPGNNEVAPAYNLAPHTWAGLPVEFVFEVKDKSDQTGTSNVIEYVLPEREFEHPIAKRLVAIRKDMAWKRDLQNGVLIQKLENLLRYPNEFENNVVVFLAIKSAAARLYYRPSDEMLLKTIRLLWDAAVLLEDGNLNLAMRELADKIQTLQSLLNNDDASEEDFRSELGDLREALNEYMKSLQNELRKKMESDKAPMITPEMLDQTLNEDILNQFMNELSDNIQSQDKQGAQELLSQLQKLMETLTPAIAGDMPQDMQDMMSGISEIQELVNKQKLLKKQTEELDSQTPDLQSNSQTLGRQLAPNSPFTKEWDMGDMPPPPSAQEYKKKLDEQQQRKADMMKQLEEFGKDFQTKSGEQSGLRYILGQLMQETGEAFGEIPEGMGKAERSMKGSQEHLKELEGKPSIQDQDDAIKHLEEAMEDMAEQLQKRLEEMSGTQMGQSQTDPLGRPRSGQQQQNGFFGDRVEIPNETQQKYIRDILRILRERSGQLERPDYERNYIDRLLEKF